MNKSSTTFSKEREKVREFVLLEKMQNIKRRIFIYIE
jgi:hypothetical protein